MVHARIKLWHQALEHQPVVITCEKKSRSQVLDSLTTLAHARAQYQGKKNGKNMQNHQQLLPNRVPSATQTVPQPSHGAMNVSSKFSKEHSHSRPQVRKRVIHSLVPSVRPVLHIKLSQTARVNTAGPQAGGKS